MGCNLSTGFRDEGEYHWLSSEDHCQWTGVYCNEENEITQLYLREHRLSKQLTIFELEKLAVIADQYESLQDEARSANDQVNNLTQRLAQNASR